MQVTVEGSADRGLDHRRQGAVLTVVGSRAAARSAGRCWARSAARSCRTPPDRWRWCTACPRARRADCELARRTRARESPSARRELSRSDRVLGVDDAVAVALLGEEALPVGGEVGVHGVAGHDGEEPRGVRRRPSAAAAGPAAGPPPAGSRRPRRPGWPPGRWAGRSEKLATLLTTSRSISPVRNASYSRSRCRTVVSPVITGASSRSARSSSWSTYWPITSVGVAAVLGHQVDRPPGVFDSAVAASRYLHVRLGDGVRHPLGAR